MSADQRPLKVYMFLNEGGGERNLVIIAATSAEEADKILLNQCHEWHFVSDRTPYAVVDKPGFVYEEKMAIWSSD